VAVVRETWYGTKVDILHIIRTSATVPTSVGDPHSMVGLTTVSAR